MRKFSFLLYRLFRNKNKSFCYKSRNVSTCTVETFCLKIIFKIFIKIYTIGYFCRDSA